MCATKGDRVIASHRIDIQAHTHQDVIERKEAATVLYVDHEEVVVQLERFHPALAPQQNIISVKPGDFTVPGAWNLPRGLVKVPAALALGAALLIAPATFSGHPKMTQNAVASPSPSCGTVFHRSEDAPVARTFYIQI